LLVANGHIDDVLAAMRKDVGHKQPPHLLRQQPDGTFDDIAAAAGGGFATPKLGRGAAFGDGPLTSTVTTSSPATAASGSGWLGRNPTATQSAPTLHSRPPESSSHVWSRAAPATSPNPNCR
jgi:hypothetical protein